MAAIFGPGGPIILPWTVHGDCFSGGTVHGVTGPVMTKPCAGCDLPHPPLQLQKTSAIDLIGWAVLI